VILPHRIQGIIPLLSEPRSKRTSLRATVMSQSNRHATELG
jgi:hypothetical protein